MSTSTGYPAKVITMEQPSSSGQISAIQSGSAHHYESGGKARFKSGSSQVVDSGASFRDANVETSTAAATISVRGLTVLNNTAAATFTLPRPTAAGMLKEVVFKSTFATKLKTTGATINFGSTSKDVLSVTNSTKDKLVGYAVQFRSASTNVWRPITPRSTLLASYSSST